MAEHDPWSELVDQLWQANPFSKLVPIDPGEMTRAMQQIWLASLRDPGAAWSAYTDFVQRYTEVVAQTTARLWGIDGAKSEPVLAPAPGDRRFETPDWQRNPLLDGFKQAYLLMASTLLRSAAEMQGLDPRQQRKLVFYVRQFLDAVSPTNFLLTNPEAVHEAMATGGQSLVMGVQNLLRDLQAGQIKMTDSEAFAPGRNLALTPGQVIYRNQLIELIQYAPATDTVHAVPLLFIPPWINKFYILDMRPENSLIRFLVEHGLTVFVISWKNPDASMEETTFDDYLELGPLAALEVTKAITGSRRVHSVGYCIGGTLLSMLLPYLAAKRNRTVESASFFVALQDFAEVGDTAVFIDEPQVAYIEAQMMERGYLESRHMSAMFNMLRANDLIWSNVVNNYLLGKEPPAFDLLYWNADGTRMARAAHSFYLRNTYLENNLVQPGKVSVKGVAVDLGRIREELYIVGAEQDHIVPWQSAWKLTRLVSGPSRFALAASGHIAGVISPPTKSRGYWARDGQAAETPAAWLEGAERRPGSWWTDWVDWLRPRMGKQVPPPPLGGERYPPLAPAPGTYVLEK